MRRVALLFGLGLTPLLAGCLDPLASDEIDPARSFGDPSITDPATATHLEDDPMFTEQVKQFATSVAYLRAYAEGGVVWYWNVDGPNSEIIAPIYFIVGADGRQVGRPIIDQIPGQNGYTPWWRKIVVRTTAKYNQERIWSRDAVEAGIRLGILASPEETDEVYDLPVIKRDAKIPVDRGQTVDTEWGWYRNRRVSWVPFKDPYRVEPGKKEMPIFIVYVLQRIDQAAPIYEFVSGVDVNGDGFLDNSNNIFEGKLDAEKYSPLWYVGLVRVQADYPSIDNTASATVALDAATDFVDPQGNITSPLVVPGRIALLRDYLVNCPIQRAKGSL